MEPLREKIKISLSESIKTQDSVVTSTLRLILAAIKDRDIESRSKKKGDLIPDVEILNLLQNMINQRKESVEIYSKAGRVDLSQREEKEIEVISSKAIGNKCPVCWKIRESACERHDKCHLS